MDEIKQQIKKLKEQKDSSSAEKPLVKPLKSCLKKPEIKDDSASSQYPSEDEKIEIKKKKPADNKVNRKRKHSSSEKSSDSEQEEQKTRPKKSTSQTSSASVQKYELPPKRITQVKR